MSMASKIFTLIALLILISLGVLGLAVYSTTKIADVADGLVSLGNRSAALHKIDEAILHRIIQIREINASIDENAIAAIVNGDFAENEKIVSAYIAEYEANIPEDADQTMREVGSNLTGLWNTFVAESKKVAEFSLENTNNKAARVNDENFSFWEELEAAFAQLADLLLSREDQAGVQDSLKILNLRADLVRIQLTLAKFIHETDKEVTAKYKAGIGQFVEHCDLVMNGIAATAPPDKGGRLAKQIFDNLMVGRGKPIIGEILQLVERDTNTLSNRQMLGPTSGAIQKIRSAIADYLAEISASQG